MILERCADELDARAATVADATLSLDEAAAASGYSVAHLRRLIARGVLDDVGTNGVVALRQQDLPYKAKRQRHPLPLGVLSSLTGLQGNIVAKLETTVSPARSS